MLSCNDWEGKESALTDHIQHGAVSSRQCNKARKWNKSYADQKEEIKLVPIWRLSENPKEATKKVLKRINSFRKVSGHTISIQNQLYSYNCSIKNKTLSASPVKYV